MSMDAWLFFGFLICMLMGIACVCAARVMLDKVIERQQIVTVLHGLTESKLRELKREQANGNGKAANG